MIRQTYCPHCGAPMRPYRVKITPMMVHAIVKFREAVIDHNRNSIHILKDMKGKPYELTRHEWNNFTKQRFLGLAVRVKGESGYWLLTKRGAAFLNGQEEVPAYVVIFRNKIIERSEWKQSVKDVIGSTPYLEQKGDIQYGEPREIPEAKFDEAGQGMLI